MERAAGWLGRYVLLGLGSGAILGALYANLFWAGIIAYRLLATGQHGFLGPWSDWLSLVVWSLVYGGVIGAGVGLAAGFACGLVAAALDASGRLRQLAWAVPASAALAVLLLDPSRVFAPGFFHSRPADLLVFTALPALIAAGAARLASQPPRWSSFARTWSQRK